MATGDSYTLNGQVRVTDAEAREHEPFIKAKRITNIPTNMQMKIDYSSGTLPIYVGYAPKGLATSSSGWLIHKFTWDASDNCTAREIAYGIWDNRATLTFS